MITLEAILYVPEMKSNLLSVRCLVKMVIFDEGGAKVVSGGTVGVVAELEGGFFVIRQ